MINNIVEKSKTYIDSHTNEFITDFLGLKRKGHNRCVCPFCGHKDAGMSYFKSGFWGCYHSNCDANEGAGDSVTLAILVLNNLKPNEYKNLPQSTKKELFVDTINKIKNWIGIEKLQSTTIAKKYSKSAEYLDVFEPEFEEFFKKIENKSASFWDSYDFEKYLINKGIEKDKISYLSKTYQKMVYMQFLTYDDIIYYFIDKAQVVNIDVFYHLKPLYKILQLNYFNEKSENFCKNIIKNYFVPANWSRFAEEQRKKFKLFDIAKIDNNSEPIKFFENYHFYPIYDDRNTLVGLQGRVKEISELNSSSSRQIEFISQLPKCLNLRNFERGKVIYNLNNLPENTNFVVIHEGPADVIAADSFGVNAISFLGKTMSSYQFNLLKKKVRKATPIIIALDNDSAGKIGATKIAEELVTHFKNVFIVSFKDFKDPGEAKKAQYITALQYNARRYI